MTLLEAYDWIINNDTTEDNKSFPNTITYDYGEQIIIELGQNSYCYDYVSKKLFKIESDYKGKENWKEIGE